MQGAGEVHAPRLRLGRLLEGANVHHHSTVFVQPLVPGMLAGADAPAPGPEFAARFAARFGGGAPGGLLPPAQMDQARFPLVATLLEAIIAIERHLGRVRQRLEEPTFARIHARQGRLDLVWESRSAATSQATARVALAGLCQLLPGPLATILPRFDFAKQMERLRRQARRHQWSTMAATLAMAASQRRLRCEVLTGGYVCIGEGVRQRAVSASSLGISLHALRGRQPADPDRFAVGDGTLHRLLVVNGVLVSALRCDPPRVVGDGSRTVGQLIAELNRAPARMGPVLHGIPIDATMTSALAEDDLSLDDVPPMGHQLLLRGAATPERGAAVADVTMTVHDDVRRAALRASADHPGPVAIIDCLPEDGRGGGSSATGSVAPDLHLHAGPDRERRREVGDALLGAVFAGESASVPTVCLVGERGTRRVARVVERLLRATHGGVALATQTGASIDGVPLQRTACASYSGPAFLLGDPRTNMLVAAMSPRRVVERGFGLERCSVAAILGATESPPSAAYCAAVAVCLATAPGGVVVGADNPLLDEVLASIAPTRAFITTRRHAHPALPRHLAAGRAVVRPSEDRTAIELLRGNDIIASIPIATLVGAEASVAGRGLGAALYAAAITQALGCNGDLLTSPRDRQPVAAQPG